MSREAPVSSSDTGTHASSANGPVGSSEEDNLRRELRKALAEVVAKEPLESTWKHLLTTAVVTPRKPILLKDRLYSKSIGARLRERATAEAFQKFDNPWDKIAQRQPIEDDALKSALTLREPKKHEQEALLKRTLQAMPRGPNKRILEGMALGLQSKELKRQQRAQQQAEAQSVARRRQADLEKHRIQEQRRRADLRRLRDDEAANTRRNRYEFESPRQALRKYTSPLFQKLWDMEFANLGNTNPFRLVIDKKNCAAMGAPDYFSVVKTPMNLTYIKDKVHGAEYESLQSFFSDVNLMLQNALLYNSDPNNDYHLAAKEMKAKFQKMAKKVITSLKKKQLAQQQAQKKR